MTAARASARRLAVLLVVPAALAVGCSDTGTSTNAGPAVEATSGGSSSTATTDTTAKTTKTTKATKPTTTAKGSTTSRPKTTETVGSSDDPTTTGADPAALPDACDLLTEDDATLAFGEPVVAGDQGTDECWWSTRNDLKVVNLIRRTDDLDEWRAGYQNDKWEPVDRGDEGYQGKVLSSIVFRIGEVQYEVNVNYSTKGDADQAVSDLADAVLARLG